MVLLSLLLLSVALTVVLLFAARRRPAQRFGDDCNMVVVGVAAVLVARENVQTTLVGQTP